MNSSVDRQMQANPSFQMSPYRKKKTLNAAQKQIPAVPGGLTDQEKILKDYPQVLKGLSQGMRQHKSMTNLRPVTQLPSQLMASTPTRPAGGIPLKNLPALNLQLQTQYVNKLMRNNQDMVTSLLKKSQEYQDNVMMQSARTLEMQRSLTEMSHKQAVRNLSKSNSLSKLEHEPKLDKFVENKLQEAFKIDLNSFAVMHQNNDLLRKKANETASLLDNSQTQNLFQRAEKIYKIPMGSKSTGKVIIKKYQHKKPNNKDVMNIAPPKVKKLNIRMKSELSLPTNTSNTLTNIQISDVKFDEDQRSKLTARATPSFKPPIDASFVQNNSSFSGNTSK